MAQLLKKYLWEILYATGLGIAIFGLVALLFCVAFMFKAGIIISVIGVIAGAALSYISISSVDNKEDRKNI